MIGAYQVLSIPHSFHVTLSHTNPMRVTSVNFFTQRRGNEDSEKPSKLTLLSELVNSGSRF